MSLDGKYVIGDDSTVRVEDDYGDRHVQVFVSLEDAQREQGTLNDGFNGFLLSNDGLVPARPWKVYQLKEEDPP